MQTAKERRAFVSRDPGNSGAMMRRRACLAAAAVLLCALHAFGAAAIHDDKTLAALSTGTAAGEDGDKASPLLDSLTVGLEGSFGREANAKDHNWGPTLSLSLLSKKESAHYGFNYELEGSYNDSYSKLSADDSTQETRLRTSELKYGKLSFLKFAGFDLEDKLRFVPYISGGEQYVNSREETPGNEDDIVNEGDPIPAEVTEVARQSYWAPTWGAGLKFSLSKRTTFTLDYEQNMAGNKRKISRLTLGLSVNIFGDTGD